MTNYNDGNWHGWNGGEMHVHGDSVVELVSNEPDTWADFADGVNWEKFNGAFRVVNEYVEPRKPRELWVAFDRSGYIKEVSDNREYMDDLYYHSVVKFREVLDDES